MSPAPDHGTQKKRHHRPDRGRARRLVDDMREFLDDDMKSGLLVISIALVAILVSNSPLQQAYEYLSHLEFGPSVLGLHLSVHEWAADGLQIGRAHV